MKKIKRIVTLIFVLVASVLAAVAFFGCGSGSEGGNSKPGTPGNVNNNPNDNLVFVEQSDGTYGVKTTNKNIEGALVIPAIYNEKAVTVVLEKGFYNCKKLTSVLIPNGVKIIKGEAFAYCNGLDTVTIYPSIKEINVLAFAYCGEFDFIHIGEDRNYDGCWRAGNVCYESTPNYIYQTESN